MRTERRSYPPVLNHWTKWRFLPALSGRMADGLADRHIGLVFPAKIIADYFTLSTQWPESKVTRFA